MNLRASSGALAALVALATVSGELDAQPANIPRVGILMGSSAAAGGHLVEAFFEGMREHGYVDGKTIRYDVRFAEGKRAGLDQHARELVNAKVAVILAPTTPAADAARKTTSSIPIVFSIVADPVGAGLVRSLAAPGGNVTGIGTLASEVAAKRVDLMRELMPKSRRLGYLHDPRGTPTTTTRITEKAAHVLGKELLVVEASTAEALPGAFSKLKELGAEALVVDGSPFLFLHRRKVLELAAASRLPTISSSKEWVRDGGLMSYGAEYADSFRRSAAYVDRILKGAKPADLPVQQSTKFELIVNLKTAKALGIIVPPSILLRADQVID